jgi:hypothetical protein
VQDLNAFEWPVDQHGYEVRPKGGDGDSLLESQIIQYVEGRGGPSTHYRPMEDHPGLWRQFAETCIDIAGVTSFATKYGLLHETRSPLDGFLNAAAWVRHIAARLDEGDREEAAKLFSEYGSPRFIASIVRNGRSNNLEFKLHPITLHSALLLQTGDAITGNRKWRRCKNCDVWFPLGAGAHTERRQFCKTACRVAWGRRQRKETSL